MGIRWRHILIAILLFAVYKIEPEAIGHGLKSLGAVIADGLIPKN
jgi:membrane protein involved in colicin uptake